MLRSGRLTAGNGRSSPPSPIQHPGLRPATAQQLERLLHQHQRDARRRSRDADGRPVFYTFRKQESTPSAFESRYRAVKSAAGQSGKADERRIRRTAASSASLPTRSAEPGSMAACSNWYKKGLTRTTCRHLRKRQRTSTVRQLQQIQPVLKTFRQGNLERLIYRVVAEREQPDDAVSGGLNFWLPFNNNWSVYDDGSTFAEGRTIFEPRKPTTDVTM